MSDDDLINGPNSSWDMSATSNAKENFVAGTKLNKTSDESVYGDQPDLKVATLSDPIPIEDQLRDALQRGLPTQSCSPYRGAPHYAVRTRC